MADTVQKQQHFDVIVYITQPLQLFIIFHPLRVVLDIIRSIHSKFQGRTPKKISHVQSVQKYWKRPLVGHRGPCLRINCAANKYWWNIDQGTVKCEKHTVINVRRSTDASR